MVIIIIGAESTATRALTEQFSRNPAVLGTPKAMSHEDVLDEVWQLLEKGERSQAKDALSRLIGNKILVTRRSVPHGTKPGVAAEFGTFPALGAMIELTLELECSPFVLVTTRSPIPNIMSWKAERASSQGSSLLAYRQYQSCYKKIFSTLGEHDTPYFIVSVEQYILDSNNFIKSLYKFFNIDSVDIFCSPKEEINDRRYKDYLTDNNEITITDILSD